MEQADGGSLPDRYLAPAFPSNYAIDPNGVIIFTHVGAIENWKAFLRLFKHAVEVANE